MPEGNSKLLALRLEKSAMRSTRPTDLTHAPTMEVI